MKLHSCRFVFLYKKFIAIILIWYISTYRIVKIYFMTLSVKPGFTHGVVNNKSAISYLQRSDINLICMCLMFVYQKSGIFLFDCIFPGWDVYSSRNNKPADFAVMFIITAVNVWFVTGVIISSWKSRTLQAW